MFKEIVNKMPLPPPRIVFVDVDGTLIKQGKLDAVVVNWIENTIPEGFEFILWSSRGEDYARNVATRCNVEGLFKYIISKPGYILDDKGWGWIKYTFLINPDILKM